MSAFKENSYIGLGMHSKRDTSGTSYLTSKLRGKRKKNNTGIS